MTTATMSKRDRDEDDEQPPRRRRDEVVPLERLSPEQMIELALRAIALRRTGNSWGTIAGQLGRSQIEVEALARQGYAHFLGQQDADTIRAEIEDRLDAIVRRVNVELATAETVMERNALLRTLLAAEQSRARLLGLNLKPQGAETDA